MANEEIRLQNLDKALNVAYHLFLEHGIDRTTKEMIARQSGLSRKSIDRYFPDKVDCVLNVAQWFLEHLKDNFSEKYPDSMFKGKYTGAQLLEMYMKDIKELFWEEPRVFVLYSEFKIFIYRNCDDFQQGYTLFINWMGNRDLRQKIYNLGRIDGSLPQGINLETEEEYFCESYFGFLANMALSFDVHSPIEISKQIDNRIENTIAIYTGVESYVYKEAREA